MRTIHLRILILLGFFSFLACTDRTREISSVPGKSMVFNPQSLVIQDSECVKKIHGQLLYMPIYSNVPYLEKNRKFDLSAFLEIHNTDLSNTIRITKVLYFNSQGGLVDNFLTRDTLVQPLGAIDFFIPEHDQSGTGSNFLVEWVSDSLVNEPLIETVMLGLSSGQGVSFSSAGKVIRERK